MTGPAQVSDRGRASTGPRETERRNALLLAGLCALVGALAGLGLIPCGFARMTHHPCPGCGSTRSVWALLHGDWDGFWRMNPLGAVMGAIVGAIVVRTVWATWVGDRTTLRSGFMRWSGAVMVALTVLQVLVWGARFCGYLGGPVPV